MQHGILLIGPTGCGKTPLGTWMESRGIAGRRCHHFDFGENLRRVGAGIQAGFTPEERAFIEDLVRRGALLEDSSFPLALRILDSFRAVHGVTEQDLLIMNGLPRHIGQARGIAHSIRMIALVQLECSAEVVEARLSGNTGGDRASRTDDQLALVRQKLELFERRTAPLVDFYRAAAVPVMRVSVRAQTVPEQMLCEIGEELTSAIGAVSRPRSDCR